METRADIERILDQSYGARQRQDLEDALRFFHNDAPFRLNGMAAVAANPDEHRRAIQGLFDTFQVLEFHSMCRLIDPPRAAVNWRGKFRVTKTGQIAEIEILDLFEIRNGRIASLTSFFDSAQVERLQG